MRMSRTEQEAIIALIKREVVPAIGCTEPMAVSLCVAKAARLLGCQPEHISLHLSGNILKNAMGVGIPGTGMIGLPIPNTEVKMCDPMGNEVAVGEVGELKVKGPQVMKGYWDNPQETAAVFDADGFLATGDIGVMNEWGFIQLIDRKKDMVNVSGFNVYPNEVEDVVVAMDGIREAACIGIADEKTGEALKLFAVKSDNSITEQDVTDHCRKELTAYKVPKVIEFRDDLPKSSVGKILRRELREESLLNE